MTRTCTDLDGGPRSSVSVPRDLASRGRMEPSGGERSEMSEITQEAFFAFFASFARLGTITTQWCTLSFSLGGELEAKKEREERERSEERHPPFLRFLRFFRHLILDRDPALLRSPSSVPLFHFYQTHFRKHY
jgi:hypothetical protein